MESEDARQLLLRLMALADRMEQRDAKVVQEMAQQASLLQQSAQAVSHGGQQFSRNALDVLRTQGRDAVQSGVEQAVAQCNQQLTETGKLVSRASGEVQSATAALRHQRSLWLWTAPLALLVGAALAAGGSSYLVWKNMAELERADFGQDILQATQSGKLTRCGEALCAKIGAKPQRFGKQGEYLLLQE